MSQEKYADYEKVIRQVIDATPPSLLEGVVDNVVLHKDGTIHQLRVQPNHRNPQKQRSYFLELMRFDILAIEISEGDLILADGLYGKNGNRLAI